MKVPPIDNRPGEWPHGVIENWTRLLARAQHLESKAGGSDAFEQMLATFREMMRTGRFDGFKALLTRRLAARALTWLWLHDDVIGPRLLNIRLLNTLIEAQQPRLTRITLVQMVQLYFRFFDRLDDRDKTAEQSLRAVLEAHVHAQLRLLPEPRMQSLRPDALTQLKQHGYWLLGLEGPLALAKHVREQGQELAATFEAYGLAGLSTSRYGDVCRAHFYLETLRQLVPGEWDEVLDELLKPSVSKAPYEGDKRIGHAALEIIIDRAGDAPSDIWQSFILNLAGDPRIASSSPNYRQWWLPLGEARINQVRGWLSKEDLRLFLQAVEQYGNESGKEDLQRMFPARKTFLEGLFKLGLIRHTRLMLGGIAQQSVRRILGEEVKTNFAKMEGSMNDKAAIYLDCGDFHLVEGSHSFKIWVYLAQPGPAMKSYEKNLFSHSDLTIELPKVYKKLYPGLGYEAVTHNGTWQRKVFDCLAENGIGVDIEKLLSKQEYRSYLNRHGVPVVRSNKVIVPPAIQSSMQAVKPERLPEPGSNAFETTSYAIGSASAASRPLTEPRTVGAAVEASVVNSIRAQNNAIADAGYSGSRRLFGKEPDVGTALAPVDSALPSVVAAVAESASAPLVVNELSGTALAGSITRLPKSAIAVMHYFASNPGDKARYASNVLEIEIREVNRLLHGPLRTFCKQDESFGWSVSGPALAVLNKLFP